MIIIVTMKMIAQNRMVRIYKLNDYVAVIENADIRLASLISNLYWDEITICDKSKIISI